MCSAPPPNVGLVCQAPPKVGSGWNAPQKTLLATGLFAVATAVPKGGAAVLDLELPTLSASPAKSEKLTMLSDQGGAPPAAVVERASSYYSAMPTSW